VGHSYGYPTNVLASSCRSTIVGLLGTPLVLGADSAQVVDWFRYTCVGTYTVTGPAVRLGLIALGVCTFVIGFGEFVVGAEYHNIDTRQGFSMLVYMGLCITALLDAPHLALVTDYWKA
jgi:hypothetical protein